MKLSWKLSLSWNLVRCFLGFILISSRNTISSMLVQQNTRTNIEKPAKCHSFVWESFFTLFWTGFLLTPALSSTLLKSIFQYCNVLLRIRRKLLFGCLQFCGCSRRHSCLVFTGRWRRRWKAQNAILPAPSLDILTVSGRGDPWHLQILCCRSNLVACCLCLAGRLLFHLSGYNTQISPPHRTIGVNTGSPLRCLRIKYRTRPPLTANRNVKMITTVVYSNFS